MPLQGSLKDFGLAEIFSAIAAQTKTGSLAIVHRDERVTLFFHRGALVRSHMTRRATHDLLGAMLLRAAVVTPAALDDALRKQKVTHKRLGVLLVDSGAVSQQDLDTFATLQSTELVYRVFLWRGGTYEFTASDVAPEALHTPVKAETLLSDGFRQADAWPMIRQKVQSYAATYAKVVPDIDAIAARGNGAGGARLKNIGPHERRIFALVAPNRDVQTLIDLSRLGEFETCLSLHALCEAGLVALHARSASAAPSAEATVGGITSAQPLYAHRQSASWAAGAGLLLCIWMFLTVGAGLSPWEAEASAPVMFVNPALEMTLGAASTRQLRFFLQVHQALRGAYPAQLSQISGMTGIMPDTLHFPWQEAYFYQRHEQSYQLLRPLF